MESEKWQHLVARRAEKNVSIKDKVIYQGDWYKSFSRNKNEEILVKNIFAQVDKEKNGFYLLKLKKFQQTILRLSYNLKKNLFFLSTFAAQFHLYSIREVGVS